MSTPEHYRGGCLCGAVEYRIDEIFDAGYCHCSSCRRASGGAVLAWAHVHEPNFELVAGEPETFAVSEAGARHFCGDCGSTLYFRAADGSFYSVTIGTFDDPERVRPKLHICIDDALEWLEIDDELPRYSDNRSPHPDERGE